MVKKILNIANCIFAIYLSFHGLLSIINGNNPNSVFPVVFSGLGISILFLGISFFNDGNKILGIINFFLSGFLITLASAKYIINF
ncbi:hypothetical protein [Clostridium sp. BJN0001]|uniref:hypothetical protein n=1 Tax=Clostridium sp. BJN0001 TaxID=2930219 RepID=UPI001FD3338E|nr:hypothetical protein [Clostridium sp. BJN0001]